MAAALTATTAAPLALAAASQADQPMVATGPATIDLTITGLRNTNGQLLVCMTALPKAFPDCNKDPAAVRVAVKASVSAPIRLVCPTPGTYAIAVVHDENGNAKMDMRLFLPREGFGFSRNPKLGMGPPKFAASSLLVAGPRSETIRMKYM